MRIHDICPVPAVFSRLVPIEVKERNGGLLGVR